MSSHTVTVHHGEATEMVACTKNIDAALLSILAMLEKHQIAQDMAMDLAAIASNSLYVRRELEEVLKCDAKASSGEAAVPS